MSKYRLGERKDVMDALSGICVLSSTQEIKPSLKNFRNLNTRGYRDHLMESLSTTHYIKKELPSIGAHTCDLSTREAEAEADTGGLKI